MFRHHHAKGSARHPRAEIRLNRLFLTLHTIDDIIPEPETTEALTENPQP
jgi:hypothetical protein